MHSKRSCTHLSKIVFVWGRGISEGLYREKGWKITDKALKCHATPLDLPSGAYSGRGFTLHPVGMIDAHSGKHSIRIPRNDDY